MKTHDTPSSVQNHDTYHTTFSYQTHDKYVSWVYDEKYAEIFHCRKRLTSVVAMFSLNFMAV